MLFAPPHPMKELLKEQLHNHLTALEVPLQTLYYHNIPKVRDNITMQILLLNMQNHVVLLHPSSPLS